jgi:uncharacterized protein (DUF2147 family)
MNVRVLLIFVAVLSAPLASAGGIAGIWKYAEEPAWIEIQFEDGVGKGTVVRNDVYPERVGREILIALRADEHEDAVWRGQVYVFRLGDLKDVEMSLDESGLLRMKVKVGFISRTVDWIRVDEVPRKPA